MYTVEPQQCCTAVLYSAVQIADHVLISCSFGIFWRRDPFQTFTTAPQHRSIFLMSSASLSSPPPSSCAFLQSISISTHLSSRYHFSNTCRTSTSTPTAMKPPTKVFTILNTTQSPKTTPSPSPPSFPPSQLPSSSKNALAASVLLSTTAFSIPILLALQDTSIHPDISFIQHLLSYTSHYELMLATVLFSLIHSGLASLRPIITPYITERLYRVIFALASIPSAVALITFFVIHRYDGHQLFPISLQSIPSTHSIVYILTMFAFLFLYPATFNLLEVAAVQKPTFKFYEKGITRICRHPQLVGQFLWGVSHTLWIGSSFSLITAISLVAYHCFGVWNGDRRLYQVYGNDWIEYSNRTSILPFAAIVTGKQDFKVKEFLVPAYVGVVLAALGFYAAHPAVLNAVSNVHF